MGMPPALTQSILSNPIQSYPMLPAYLTSDADLHALPNIAKLWPLTRFEKVAVVANRAQALAQGATPMVACKTADFDVIDIATRELHCGVLPPTRVFRYMPNETAVAVSVADVFRASKRSRLAS